MFRTMFRLKPARVFATKLPFHCCFFFCFSFRSYDTADAWLQLCMSWVFLLRWYEIQWSNTSITRPDSQCRVKKRSSIQSSKEWRRFDRITASREERGKKSAKVYKNEKEENENIQKMKCIIHIVRINIEPLIALTESEWSIVSLYRYYLLNYITFMSVCCSFSIPLLCLSFILSVYRHDLESAYIFTQTFIACLVSGRRWALAADSQHVIQRHRTILYTFHDISFIVVFIIILFFLRAYVRLWGFVWLCGCVHDFTLFWMCARKQRKRKKYK